MLEIEQEKITLIKYLRDNAFKLNNEVYFSKKDCLKISINPNHCLNLLELLSDDGYFKIKSFYKYYCDDDEILEEIIPGIDKKIEAEYFCLVKNSIINFPNNLPGDKNYNNNFIYLDDNKNIIWGNKTVIFPATTKESIKYQVVIKQIIENCPNGGSTTYPIIAKQINDKTKGGISSQQIIEFFRRAKIDNKPISETTKVDGNEIKIFDTSKKLTVTFNNKSGDQ